MALSTSNLKMSSDINYKVININDFHNTPTTNIIDSHHQTTNEPGELLCLSDLEQHREIVKHLIEVNKNTADYTQTDDYKRYGNQLYIFYLYK